MNALEFSGKIEEGKIKLPEEYKDYDNSNVRVIVLVEESQNILMKKERLRDAFQKMKKVDMFQKIKSPTSWQKHLRNEWE